MIIFSILEKFLRVYTEKQQHRDVGLSRKCS